jgi:hypothetical protein
MRANERCESLLDQRSFDGNAVDGVRAVEHRKEQSTAGDNLHGVEHGREIGTVADADVLNIEDECVQAGQHLGRGGLGFAVEAIDGQSGARVGCVQNRLAGLGIAAHAVFRTEERLQLDCVGLVQQVDSTAELAVDGRVIGNQAAGESGKLRVPLFEENFKTGSDAWHVALLTFGL